MPSPLTIGTLALLALGVVVGPAQAATATSAAVPLSAKTTTCTTGEDDGSRAATFTGSMPAIAGTQRMQMRFVLVQRLGEKGAYKRVEVPGWGGWQKSDFGRPGFVFTKRVEALAAPASYRAQITFKWLDKKSHTQRTVTKTSTACAQPDPRPDLTLAALDITAEDATHAVYTVAVSNDGRSDAAPFTVTVTVDGVVQPPLPLGPLAAGERVQGTITGTRCAPGSTVTVTVDAQGAVDESDEADDTVQRPCQIG
jgi:hypothetical protein